jgi:hypothetical protein
MHHHVADGFWMPAERRQSGIAFSAKKLLEVDFAEGNSFLAETDVRDQYREARFGEQTGRDLGRAGGPLVTQSGRSNTPLALAALVEA